MRETRYYTVAGHGFCVEAEVDDFGVMQNYEAFRTSLDQTTPGPSRSAMPLGSSKNSGGEKVVFAISIGDGEKPEYTEEFRQEEEGQTIVCGYSTERKEAVYEFLRPVGSKRPEVERAWAGETAGWLVAKADYHSATLVMAGNQQRKFAIDNALMVMFALATADKDTLLFHAAVVSHEGRGYMFLGPSGTGKSTHARLWLQHIEGTELVNDDNPVVRGNRVYGSPWSGKTPCYRNVSYPLGGIVLLSQAPYNKITRLGGLQAYAALVMSISGKRWDARIADGLHEAENKLVSHVPMWHLECLPDGAAAELCQVNIKH